MLQIVQLILKQRAWINTKYSCDILQFTPTKKRSKLNCEILTAL